MQKTSKQPVQTKNLSALSGTVSFQPLTGWLLGQRHRERYTVQFQVLSQLNIPPT